MSFRFNRLACAMALGFGVAAAPAFADTLQGTVGDHINGAYAASFTNVTYVPSGASFTDAATLICIDLSNQFPTAGSVHTYDVISTGLAPVANAGASARATDLFNYAVDTYYNSMVLHPTSGVSTGYQFSGLMWEIATDFTGSAASLNSASGAIRVQSLDAGNAAVGAAPEYVAMVNDLRTNFNNIAVGYRSTQYNVSFLDDQTPGWQSMMMITPTAPVPEPSTLALSLLGGLGLFGWKQRRSNKQR